MELGNGDGLRAMPVEKNVRGVGMRCAMGEEKTLEKEEEEEDEEEDLPFCLA